MDSDESFIQTYEVLNCVITESADKAFGRAKYVPYTAKEATNPEIRGLIGRKRLFGTVRFLYKNPLSARVRQSARDKLAELQANFTSDSLSTTFDEFFSQRFRSICRALYCTQANEVYTRARIRRNMGIALPGYPQVIPVSSRVPAYVIPAGNTTG